MPLTRPDISQPEVQPSARWQLRGTRVEPRRHRRSPLPRRPAGRRQDNHRDDRSESERAGDARRARGGRPRVSGYPARHGCAV